MRFERAIVLLAAIAAALATARLGVWQLDRASQKTALQRSLDERRKLPPLLADALASSPEQAAEQHHRRVELRGRWRDDATIYLENRQMEGRPGFFVLTPLVLADGSAVIVQRGWLPRDAQDRTRVQAPRAPTGEVQIEARIAPPPSRLFEMAGAEAGPIRQNLDFAAFEQELRLPLRPLSLLQLGPAEPAASLLQRRWHAPAADVHKHHGYAAQWFGLSALIVGLYVWFQLVRPRRQAAR